MFRHLQSDQELEVMDDYIQQELNEKLENVLVCPKINILILDVLYSSVSRVLLKKSSFFVEKNIDFPKNREFSDFKKHRFS